MASLRELREEIKEGLQESRCKERGLHPKRRALMSAIRNQDLEKVERLLNQGVDLNFTDAFGDYPLHVACANAVDEKSGVAVQIVEMLLYMGAELEVYDRFSHLPLHLAACNSHLMVRVLLDRGCCINAQDNAGRTALMEACCHNSRNPLNTVTLLMQHDANVHLKDDCGYTALHCLCQNSNLDIPMRNQLALLLLSAGISSTVCDHEGRMALCYELDRVTSVSHRKFLCSDLQLIETLVCAGSNLQHNSKYHQYWVRYMINSVSPKILSLLLQMVSPVLTRPCLRLISKAITELPFYDEDSFTTSLLVQIQQLMCSVDHLQAICRRSIRANLRGKLLVGVPQLPLPNKLKKFLTSLDSKPT